MAWLAGQIFLLCLVSFLTGAAITTLALRLKPTAGDAPNAPNATLGASNVPNVALGTQEPPVAEQEIVEEPEAGEPLIVKASKKSMRYHTPDSPYYNRVKGELTFPSIEEAELAGYTAWNKTVVKS
ncbi:hypothetical protein JOF56_000285 [Kibdelosporangium banguiense]|uniref:Uncharacterized protein n=1 Tax=Kibdelosporangium banguiense TaxID=1365924 RepID=A0ABS4T607_9PSEU|nr:hypothetical protein [Kibdelosporangium banguiense]MBP2319900.1 hypothetical protein [Kibdelosporangium banguiense]